LIGVFLAAAVTAAPTSAASTPTPTTARPNIVFIVTDDLDADEAARLPHTQTLIAREGANFTAAYASTPLCAPSRAAILTGRYPHTTGVRGHIDPLVGFA